MKTANIYLYDLPLSLLNSIRSELEQATVKAVYSGEYDLVKILMDNLKTVDCEIASLEEVESNA